MTYPTPQRRIRIATLDDSGATLTFPLPADLTGLGTVLLCCARQQTWNTPAGWTLLASGQDPLTVVDFAAFYRMGGGGNTAVTAAGNTFLAGIAVVMDDVDFATVAPVAQLGSAASSATVDPPSVTFSSSGDHLVITGDAHTIGNAWSTQPTNYLNMVLSRTATGGNDAILDTAFRFVNGASEDPGTYTITGARTQVPFTIAVQGVQSVPSAPTNPAATTLSQTSIRVTWDDVTDETGYYVERSPNGSTGWVNVSGSLAANTTQYDDTGLTCNTQYFYRVIAFNGAGDSSPSSSVNDTTSACTPGTTSVMPSALIRRRAMSRISP